MKQINIPALICGGALALSLSFVPSHAADAMEKMPALTNAVKANGTLAGTQWQLTSPTYAGLADKPTLNFDDARISASVGLNRMGGSFSIDGQNLKFSPLFSTKMAGPPALMKAETQYSADLDGVRSFQLSPDGKYLILRGKKTLTFARAGATKDEVLLDATKWTLTSPKFLGLKSSPTLKFEQGHVNASVGLNQIFGDYKLNGKAIALSPLGSTRMAGPRALMNAETKYSNLLQSVRTAEISPNGNTLTLRGEQTLTFVRAGVMQTDSLVNTKWLMMPVAYKHMTLEFTDKGVKASAGLNRINGNYKYSASKIDISALASTKMAGPPDLMKAENDYIQALEGATDYQISPDGQTLTLRGTQTLTFSRLTVQTNPLTDTNWELTNPIYAGLNKKPTLKFTDKAIGASVGLNGMGGGYKIDGAKIKLDLIISTMMAGPPALMKAEDNYKKALAGVKTFELSRDGQTLTLRGAQTLMFRLSGRMAQGFVPTQTKILNVAPQLGAQMDGDQTAKYLQLEDLSEGTSWGKFTEPQILGFDYQPGNRYQLRVQVERDAKSGEKQLRLLEVFSQHYVGDAKLNVGDKILEVAPTKVDCVGVAPMKCLQVREVGGPWQTFYAPIQGFDFQEGWRYRLQVNESKIANPPADGSSLRYQLVRVLDKMPVTY